MKVHFGAALLAIAFICACSSISKRQSLEPFIWPPTDVVSPLTEQDPVAMDHLYESYLRRNPNDSTKFLVRYHQARLWSESAPNKACALWNELVTNPRFPLRDVARLNAIKVCPNEWPELASYIEDANREEAPWLRSLSTEAHLKQALRSGDKKAELKWTLAAVPGAQTKKSQGELIKRGLALAEELKDESAARNLRELTKKVAPRLIDTPPADLLLAVASDFRRVREFDRSRAVYRQIVESSEFSDLDKLRALNGIRMTYKLEQKRGPYIQATYEYSDFARKHFASTPRSNVSYYVDTRLVLARAVWTENSAKEAASILHKLEKEMKGRHSLAESRFLRARIEEEAGRLKSAVKILGGIDDSKISDKTLRLNILWYHAWILRKDGRLKEAISHLERLLTLEESPFQTARDRFWLARTLKESGQEQKADAELERIIEEDPLGYYGMLAYRELKRPIPSLKSETSIRMPADFAPPDEQGSDTDSSHLFQPEEKLVFEWLLAAHENELAKRYLRQVESSHRSPLSPEQRLTLLESYARAGSYQSLFGYVTALAPETRRQILEAKPELIFPRTWSSIIEAHANKNEVPPELVYSIIRQESSFDPLARSHADAFGLMQLIPEVATLSAKANGIAIENPEDLYKPELNIPLGISFLRDTLKKWRHRFIPAVASYNASEKAVMGWLRTRNHGDVLQFIEDIPYEETRTYVKLVMRNFVFYSRLSTTQNAIPFPEWCLAGLQDFKP